MEHWCGEGGEPGFKLIIWPQVMKSRRIQCYDIDMHYVNVYKVKEFCNSMVVSVIWCEISFFNWEVPVNVKAQQAEN